jgi:uncharacterized protein with HEPN domain
MEEDRRYEGPPDPDYADVDYVIVWDVVKTTAPELAQSLRPLVESFDKNS